MAAGHVLELREHELGWTQEDDFSFCSSRRMHSRAGPWDHMRGPYSSARGGNEKNPECMWWEQWAESGRENLSIAAGLRGLTGHGENSIHGGAGVPEQGGPQACLLTHTGHTMGRVGVQREPGIQL